MAQRLTEQVAKHRGLEYRELRKRRRVLIGDEPESVFMAKVRRLAQLCGWLDFHTGDSRGTRPGEPDLRLYRPPRVVMAELKSQHGRLTIAQAQTIAVLERCPGIEVYVFRPSDWQEIVRVLR